MKERLDIYMVENGFATSRERAKELITETDAPLSVIAMNCGFQSIRSFNRVFAEMTGAVPSDLRKGK